MARRILNRKEMRADFEAAERRKEDVETDETEEEEGDEDDEEESDAEGEIGEGEEGEADDEDEGEEGDDDDEDAPKKKKKKKKVAAPKVKAKAKPRSRASKVVRLKVVWGVFNNSNQRIAVYDYPKRAEADAHAKKLTEDKKSTHFVQPLKEPMEEKKE